LGLGLSFTFDPKTLRRWYRDELDLGGTKANAQVARFLYAAAKAETSQRKYSG